MYFPLCFVVLLKQLRRLYTSAFIFQVPPVSDYSTCCAKRVPTRSVQQLRVYAFDAPTTAYASLHQPLVYKALTNQGGGALVYRPRSLLQYKGQSSSSKRAYETIRVFRAPGSDSLVLLS